MSKEKSICPRCAQEARCTHEDIGGWNTYIKKYNLECANCGFKDQTICHEGTVGYPIDISTCPYCHIGTTKNAETDIKIQIGNKNTMEEQVLEAIRIYIGSSNDLIREFAQDIFHKLDDQERKRVLLFLSQTATSLKCKTTIDGLWSIAGLRAFSASEDVLAALKGGGLIQELKDCLLLKTSAGNNAELTKALLSHGANVCARVKERYGYQPIHFAVWCDNLDMIKILLEFGANPQAVNGYGETAFDMAKERSQEIFEFLIKNINNQKGGREWAKS